MQRPERARPLEVLASAPRLRGERPGAPVEAFRDHLTGAEATTARSLQIALPDGERLWQCGNGRWHQFPPRGVPFSMKCSWGLMEYYDERVAHEAARRGCLAPSRTARLGRSVRSRGW